MVWRRKRPTTASSVTTGTGTLSGTATTITPTTTAPTAPPVLRGRSLGISAGATTTTTVLDGILALLGPGSWVRVSYEEGWTGALDGLRTITAAAHARGLRVIQAVQTSGHRYDDPARRDALVRFAADCATVALVDALEIGNEWQHAPFWQAPTYSVMPPVAQATLTIRVADAVRAVRPGMPIVTNGLSPEASSQNPYLWIPPFLDVDLPSLQRLALDGIGLHPYCYPELATTNPIQWNPLAQIPTMISSLRARSLGASIWITEIGAPGFATNPPVVRTIALDEQRQAACYAAYLDVIRQHEANGLRFPLIAFATLRDGDSATTAVESGLGLLRSDGTPKPAYDLVYRFARETAPA